MKGRKALAQHWHTNGSDDSFLIMDGDRVVGSIAKRGPHWRVEVLWSGDDIEFEATDYITAQAFALGVEMAFRRLGITPTKEV